MTKQSMRNRPSRKSGDEQDITSRSYRRTHTLRPGESDAVKRRMRRRERFEARRELRNPGNW